MISAIKILLRNDSERYVADVSDAASLASTHEILKLALLPALKNRVSLNKPISVNYVIERDRHKVLRKSGLTEISRTTKTDAGGLLHPRKHDNPLLLGPV